jgi:iron complex transport system permease protein
MNVLAPPGTGGRGAAEASLGPPARGRRPERWTRPLLVGTALAAVIAVAGLYALALGTPRVGLGDVLLILAGGGHGFARLAVEEGRLPRVLAALLGGMALAVAGTLLQNGLRNPLAGPELLGVTAGASFARAVVILLGLGVPSGALPLTALVGALAGGLIVIVANRRSRSTVRLVLIGAAVTAVFQAGVVVLISLGSQQDISTFYDFVVGSLRGRVWSSVWTLLPWLAVGLPLAGVLARPVNLLQLGDDVAEGLGLPVARTRIIIVLTASLLVAAVVAVAGPIAFIALLGPHLARRLAGSTDARILLPVGALTGAALLVPADLMARELLAPLELPVGICTTAIGGPFLLLMLRGRLGGIR